MKTESASRSSTRESRISSTAGLPLIVSQSRFDNYASPTRCGNQATLTLKYLFDESVTHSIHLPIAGGKSRHCTNRRLISRFSVQQLGIPQPEQADSRAPGSS